MAFLDGGEHVGGDALLLCYAVFQRQSLDAADFDFAGGDAVGKQVFQHADSLGADDRTDAVTVADADDEFAKRSIVDGL